MELVKEGEVKETITLSAWYYGTKKALKQLIFIKSRGKCNKKVFLFGLWWSRSLSDEENIDQSKTKLISDWRVKIWWRFLEKSFKKYQNKIYRKWKDFRENSENQRELEILRKIESDKKMKDLPTNPNRFLWKKISLVIRWSGNKF